MFMSESVIDKLDPATACNQFIIITLVHIYIYFTLTSSNILLSTPFFSFSLFLRRFRNFSSTLIHSYGQAFAFIWKFQTTQKNFNIIFCVYAYSKEKKSWSYIISIVSNHTKHTRKNVYKFALLFAAIVNSTKFFLYCLLLFPSKYRKQQQKKGRETKIKFGVFNISFKLDGNELERMWADREQAT